MLPARLDDRIAHVRKYCFTVSGLFRPYTKCRNKPRSGRNCCAIARDCYSNARQILGGAQIAFTTNIRTGMEFCTSLILRHLMRIVLRWLHLSLTNLSMLGNLRQLKSRSRTWQRDQRGPGTSTNNSLEQLRSYMLRWPSLNHDRKLWLTGWTTWPVPMYQQLQLVDHGYKECEVKEMCIRCGLDNHRSDKCFWMSNSY